MLTEQEVKAEIQDRESFNERFLRQMSRKIAMTVRDKWQEIQRQTMEIAEHDEAAASQHQLESLTKVIRESMRM